MRWEYKHLGLWELCKTEWLWIRGATPTNAGEWSVDVALGVKHSRPALWLRTGRHWGFELWLDGDHSVGWHRSRRRCGCHSCGISGGGGRAWGWFRSGWVTEDATPYDYWVELEGRWWVIHVPSMPEGWVGVTQSPRWQGTWGQRRMVRDLLSLAWETPASLVRPVLIPAPQHASKHESEEETDVS